MTKEEYRQHMRTYSQDTMVMSFVDTSHPDFQALRKAGNDIIPFLLEDLLDPHWHCGTCMGEGYEPVPTWREEWDQNKTYPPRRTGNICPECGGKGYINSWACMLLLREKAGDDGPEVPNWMRGKHDNLCKLWRKWGEARGYLPAVSVVESPNLLTKILRAIGWK